MTHCAETILIKTIEENPAVIVDGVEIPADAIAAEARQYDDKVWERAASSLVIRQLLLNEAASQGISAELDEEQALQTLLSQTIKLPEADENFCRHYFENNRAQFRSSDLYVASHILLAVAPRDFEARETAHQLAQEIIEELQDSPDSFATLAAEHSACPSKEMGGDLGQITSGSTVPEFERQLSTLPEGLHTAPIETRYGYHVLRIDQKLLGKPLSFELVHERIASKLYRQAQNHAFAEYIEQLCDRADIQGLDLMTMRKSLSNSE